MEHICKQLYTLGPKFILLKGGHLQTDDAPDIFYDGKQTTTFSLPRIPRKKIHGTGCTLSALITGYLASGKTVHEAVHNAKFILWNMIKEDYRLGHGADLLEHFPKLSSDVVPMFPTREHFSVWFEVRTAVKHLISFVPREYVPEVGMNIGYALPFAKQRDDVCAIDGRLVKTSKNIMCCGRIGFGVSKHIASIILTTMSIDSNIRCAVNFRYSEPNVDRCDKAGLRIGSFDRANEPPNAPSTMEWGTKTTITALGFIPDIIYDAGAKGKEPMIRVLGKNPHDVIDKLQKIF
jgi:hydroxymethylpyrimidine/phosphomethylpyrimidine kinase